MKVNNPTVMLFPNAVLFIYLFLDTAILTHFLEESLKSHLYFKASDLGCHLNAKHVCLQKVCTRSCLYIALKNKTQKSFLKLSPLHVHPLPPYFGTVGFCWPRKWLFPLVFTTWFLCGHYDKTLVWPCLVFQLPPTSFNHLY